MDRRCFIGALFLSVGLPVAGQAPKHYRIAYLTGYSAQIDQPLLAALKRGLHELGYVEGKNIVVEARQADGQIERLAALADELAALKPDIFVVGSGAAAAQALKRVSRDTPIVMANVQDPLGSGLVKNLARPGGNITGMSDFHAASVTKRLELMKETIPSLRLVGVLWNADSATNATQLKDLERAAPALGVKLVSLPIRNRAEIETALLRLRGERGAALLLLGDFVLTTNMARIASYAIEQRIPAVYTTRGWAEAGGFMAYGTNFEDLYRRSARFIDKILKGARPGDLPIEQPTKFDLILNLKTAKALGIEIPHAFLVRADHVIK
jgi:putative ABC transport system substrate-binding protein